MIFPPIGMVEGQDAGYYNLSLEDSTIRNSTDGGYDLARARNTRLPKKTFRTGFTEMNQSDFELFTDFWNIHTGAVIFTWLNPVDAVTRSVRFEDAPRISYVGVGAFAKYNVEVTLKEV
jgi:phage-related protein